MRAGGVGQGQVQHVFQHDGGWQKEAECRDALAAIGMDGEVDIDMGDLAADAIGILGAR